MSSFVTLKEWHGKSAQAQGGLKADTYPITEDPNLSEGPMSQDNNHGYLFSIKILAIQF